MARRRVNGGCDTESGIEKVELRRTGPPETVGLSQSWLHRVRLRLTGRGRAHPFKHGALWVSPYSGPRRGRSVRPTHRKVRTDCHQIARGVMAISSRARVPRPCYNCERLAARPGATKFQERVARTFVSRIGILRGACPEGAPVNCSRL